MKPPFYSDDRFNQMGFNEYSSIRLVGVTHESASDVIHEALYYLNSAYLDPIKTGAQIHHLRTQNDLRKLIKQEKADAVSRKRVRRREPIANQPAVLLFNRASVTYGEASFLGYFRVLEYFAQSGFEIEVQKSRRDESVPVRSLIRIVQDRSDKVQMLHLLRAVTTPTQRGRLLDYAVHHKLGHYKDFDSLAESLYKFRNSVVHAKAVEIARTLLPNPLSPENALTHWIYLAREMSMIAIRKLGSNDLTHNNIHQ